MGPGVGSGGSVEAAGRAYPGARGTAGGMGDVHARCSGGMVRGVTPTPSASAGVWRIQERFWIRWRSVSQNCDTWSSGRPATASRFVSSDSPGSTFSSARPASVR